MLIGAVMAGMLGAIVAQIATDDLAGWAGWASLALGGSAIALAAAHTYPAAVRLGRRVDPCRSTPACAVDRARPPALPGGDRITARDPARSRRIGWGRCPRPHPRRRSFVTGANGFIGRVLVERSGRSAARSRRRPAARRRRGDRAGRRVRARRMATARRGLRPGDSHRRARRDVQLGGRATGKATSRRRGWCSTPRWPAARSASSTSRRSWCSGSTSRARWTSHSRAPERSALRRHQDRERAGGARGARRRPAAVHDRAPRRRLRPRLAAVDDRTGAESQDGTAGAARGGRGMHSPVYVDDLVEGISARRQCRRRRDGSSP